ncbi:MAG: hypothetical protein R2831_02185 [Chitinophagaceae bacterium]
MERIKRAYYYFYYKIYKAWSRNYNPLLSNNFKADVSLMAIKIWLLGTIDNYLAFILNKDTKDITFFNPKIIIALILVIGSTFYFFTFSNKWKPYFDEFEKLPKRKNLIGGIIVWSIVVFVLFNVFYLEEKMKQLIR